MIDLQDAYYEKVSVRCGLTRLGPRRQRLTREQWVQQQRQARALAEAHARLDGFKSKIKTRTTEFVKNRVAEADAEAQKKIDAAKKQMDERVEAVEQKANARVLALRQEAAEFMAQLADKNTIIAAQQEQLKWFAAVLEQHGIKPGMAP